MELKQDMARHDSGVPVSTTWMIDEHGDFDALAKRIEEMFEKYPQLLTKRRKPRPKRNDIVL